MIEKNYQPRWKSWALWVSVIGALYTIGNSTGLFKMLGIEIEEGTLKTVVDCIGTILIGFGILNDPTSKDSL